MKKVSLFAAVVAAAMLAGGVTAYTVSRINAPEGKNAPAEGFIAQAGNHFTSYEQQGYPDLTYAAENGVKAVVNIEVSQEVASSRGRQGFDPFLEFFGIPQGGATPEQPRQRKGGGSGVIISPDGYIVTNNHVVDKATEMTVTLEDNRTFTATLVGTDPTTDVALIKVDAKDLPSLAFGNSDALRLGEWVLAIGSPYGLQNTITAGIISAKARNLGALGSGQDFSIESFIQTDAAVNPGNSGGALVNTAGELVGINTLIQSPTGSYAGYSFAVPSSIVKKVVVDLKEYGVVQRAILGIQFRQIDDAFIKQMGKETGITEIGGFYVAKVEPQSGAGAAGVKEGDVITEIDGQKPATMGQFLETIGKRRPNDKVTLTVKRGGQVKQIEVTLRNKAGNTDVVKKDDTAAYDALGGRFGEINDKAKKELKVDGGVQVLAITSSDGILAKARVRTGYIITHVNDRPVRSVSDLNRISTPIESIDGVYPDGRAVSYSLVK